MCVWCSASSAQCTPPLHSPLVSAISDSPTEAHTLPTHEGSTTILTPVAGGVDVEGQYIIVTLFHDTKHHIAPFLAAAQVSSRSQACKHVKKQTSVLMGQIDASKAAPTQLVPTLALAMKGTSCQVMALVAMMLMNVV